MDKENKKYYLDAHITFETLDEDKLKELLNQLTALESNKDISAVKINYYRLHSVC